MKYLKFLSGGQKAVVSLAFILALQKCDPVPFYMLDEPDAALDPEVRKAVANYLKERTDNSQFILTTFRPELVEVADKLYWVKSQNSKSKVQEITRADALNFIKDS